MIASSKNCHTCKHLEWVDGDDNSGWDCNKRHDEMWQQGREEELLQNLDREPYRQQYKPCFEAKDSPS